MIYYRHVVENSTKKWERLSLHEKLEDIIIVNEATQLGNLYGNVAALSKVFKKSLSEVVRERNKKVATYLRIFDFSNMPML